MRRSRLNHNAVCLMLLVLGGLPALFPESVSPAEASGLCPVGGYPTSPLVIPMPAGLLQRQGQDEPLQLTANLIVVPVSVTDADGHPVAGLKAEDFILWEDDRRQAIFTLGAPGERPLELALLFDVSGSLRDRFLFLQRAARAFLEAVLKPSDAVTVFSIGRTPTIVRPRTTNPQEAAPGIMSLEPTREPTAFFDAIMAGAEHLARTAFPGTRRVLIVISDGEDNFSLSAGLPEALLTLRKTDCILYAINPGGPGSQSNPLAARGQLSLEMLAKETGGAAFLTDTPESLEGVFRRVSDELRSQYLLGYYSTNPRRDGAFRSIRVEVPGRSGLRLRARGGYYVGKE